MVVGGGADDRWVAVPDGRPKRASELAPAGQIKTNRVSNEATSRRAVVRGALLLRSRCCRRACRRDASSGADLFAAISTLIGRGSVVDDSTPHRRQEHVDARSLPTSQGRRRPRRWRRLALLRLRTFQLWAPLQHLQVNYFTSSTFRLLLINASFPVPD